LVPASVVFFFISSDQVYVVESYQSIYLISNYQIAVPL
jgi:hypothetical protein